MSYNFASLYNSIWSDLQQYSTWELQLYVFQYFELIFSSAFFFFFLLVFEIVKIIL